MALLPLLIFLSLSIGAGGDRPSHGNVHLQAAPHPLQMSSLFQTGETDLRLDESPPAVMQRMSINGKEVSAEEAGKMGVQLETGGANVGDDTDSNAEDAAGSTAASSWLDGSEPVVTQRMLINGKEISPEEAAKMGIQLETAGVNASGDTRSNNQNAAGSVAESSSPPLPEQGSKTGQPLKVNVKVRLHIGSCLPELKQDAASPDRSTLNPSSFGCYDEDADGSIDDDEIKKLDWDMTSACAGEPAHKSDSNKDGKLSADEFNNVLSRFNVCINVSIK